MGAETGLENGSEVWKKFLRKHWKMVVLFVLGAILLSIGAVLVFLWFVGDAQLTGLVPTTLRLWTMGHLVTFLLHLIFWEVLFIGIPAILAAVAGWLRWKKLPDEERKEYHLFGTRSRVTSGGGGYRYCILLCSASRFLLMEIGMLLLQLGHSTISCTLAFGHWFGL